MTIYTVKGEPYRVWDTKKKEYREACDQVNVRHTGEVLNKQRIIKKKQRFVRVD